MHPPRGTAAPPHQRSLLVTVALVIAGLAILTSLAGIVLAAIALGRDALRPDDGAAAQEIGSHSVPVVISAR